MPELHEIAKELAKMGRGGDTMLAHITPQEAEILRLMGGAGTINPYTGLPEYKRFSLRRFIQQIAPVAVIAMAVFAPGIGQAIGNAVAAAVGTTVSTTTAAAIGSAVVSGSLTAAAGGDAEDVLKAAAVAGITSGVSSTVGAQLPSETSQAVRGAITGATGGATQAALTGQDIGRGATAGAITGGSVGAYRDITAPSPTYGTTSAVDRYASNIDPALRETMSAEQVMQGAQQSPYYQRAQSNIDPAQLETMSREQVLTAPVITTTTPPSREPSPLRQAGEQAVRQVAGEFARDLTRPEAPTRPDTLASTGLFQPISVVPTEITGVAPVARGQPIFGGEDEEATGTWGSKTLRG